MRRLAALLVLLTLTACGPTLEERAHAKETCEKAGGAYVERESDEFGRIFYDCYLDKEAKR